MPELPEVQTVVSDLNKKIKGDTIVSFWSDFPKAIKNINGEKPSHIATQNVAGRFQKEIKGRKILGARRIGKNMFIDLSGKKTLYLHLKMTGHLLVKRAITNNQETITKGKNINSKNKKLQTKNYFDDRVNKYVHHIWYLKTQNAKRIALEFSDMRKFAKIVLVDTDKILELPEIKKLGIDAMDPKFNLQKFTEILEKRKNKPIGIVLMEQESIAGIGNIYRSEILLARLGNFTKC